VNNDYVQIFDEIFGVPEHKEVAIRYLASLVSPSGKAEERSVKGRQIALLRDYFSTHIDGNEHYATMVEAIQRIIMDENK